MRTRLPERPGMAMTNYFNRVDGKEKRRSLRHTETAAETLVWERLRDRQLGNLKFRRQFSVGVYILDFYCSACHLAIELDGESHASSAAQESDAGRTEFLHTLGIRVLRFPNIIVYKDIDFVLAEILTASTFANLVLPSP